MLAAVAAHALFQSSKAQQYAPDHPKFGDSSSSSEFAIFADTESSDENSPDDPELKRADYWECVKCKNKQNNPMYRYCEKCYQVGFIYKVLKQLISYFAVDKSGLPHRTNLSRNVQRHTHAQLNGHDANLKFPRSNMFAQVTELQLTAPRALPNNNNNNIENGLRHPLEPVE